MIACLAASLGTTASPARADGDPVETARAHFERGTRHREAGEQREACAAFRAASASLPLWALARYEHGRCLRLLGEPGDIDPLDELREAERDMQRPAIYIELGRLFEDRGQPREALDAYQRALTLMPAEIRALEGAARVAAEVAPDKEPALLEAWLIRAPAEVGAWRRLGQLREGAGDLDGALEAYTEAASRSVDRRRGAAILGTFAQRSGSKEAAARAQRLRK